MTTEEKAIAYDKVVNKLRRFMKQGIDPLITKADVQDFFPELCEPEDEKVRKTLIRVLNENVGNGIEKYGAKLEDALAWLEKQGEQKSIIFNNAHVIDSALNDYCCKQYNALHKENGGVLSFARLQHLAMDIYSWCKKQGEQKPFDYENANIQQKDFAPKVELKFKVGDWILYSGEHYEGVRHITKIDKNGYYIERNGLPHGIIPFNHEMCMRLWTIQDAKDGDVLASELCDSIILFKGIEDNNIQFYCDYDFSEIDVPGDRFAVNNSGQHYGGVEESEDFRPATKEQRDLLFSKMKDSGYEWSEETHQLKKIEEEFNGEDYGIDGLWHAQRILEKTLGGVDGYQSDDGILEHKCAISAVKKLYKQRPAEWSEEDEKRVANILSVLSVQVCWDGATGKKMNPYQKEIDWLKSLRPQNRWKPSDEQISALDFAIDCTVYPEFQDKSKVLIELLEQLKKL